MKITLFQKQKNGQYKLKLEDGEELVTYEDLILKYDLLIHKTITEELLKALEQENKMQESYYTGLKYLKFKRRSIKETKDYLLKKEYAGNQVEYAIQKLIKQGYLNDFEYAKCFLHDQLCMTLSGPNKIRQELIKKGIVEEIINKVMEEYTIDIEQEKIIKIIDKMVKSNHNKSNAILKQKITNYLTLQGYSKMIINENLNKFSFPINSSIREKEKEKLYQKLKRKYQGKELEYKLKQKMYQKGFYDEE